GAGGITVVSDGTTALNIGTAGTNSILSLNANGSATAPAGVISVMDSSNKGITISSSTAISIDTSNLTGGALTLNPRSRTLTFPSGLKSNTFSIHGDTTGGSLKLTAGNITSQGAGALIFDTSSATGAAGSIDISLSGNTAVNIGSNTG